jgi:hypothetical protein
MAFRGQLTVEMVVIAAIMIGLLVGMFLVNEYLSTSWEAQKESFEASSAASGLAMAINRAAAGGDGTIITRWNRVGTDIVNMSIYDHRSVRAYYFAGSYSSAPLITNNTNVAGAIPINQMLLIKNRNGTITIEAA